ncbi:hypothetical protein [Chlorogloeopsis fritschii]|nr:hypothetical protein [Chlorogloeopsis fritschii]
MSPSLLRFNSPTEQASAFVRAWRSRCVIHSIESEIVNYNLTLVFTSAL